MTSAEAMAARMTYRVLVTGPRDWTDVDAVRYELSRLLSQRFIRGENHGIVFVHGACETGVDKMVADFCAKEGFAEVKITDEPHPADWYRADGSLDKSAGPRRNTKMVKLGANVGLSFWRGNEDGGTFDCTKKIVRAGIRLIVPGAWS